MVVDLVRPLGSKPGEMEVNTLAQIDNSGRVRWNPEIEAVLFPWLALEFELPLENTTLENYKFAAQGTLNRIDSNNSPYVHGWQAIYEKGRREFPSAVAAFYISGVRWSPSISTLSLNGWQVQWDDGGREHAATINNTIFWRPPRGPLLGFETNFRAAASGVSALLMPQVHIQLPGNLSLQCGVGAERASGGEWTPAAAARLIWEIR